MRVLTANFTVLMKMYTKVCSITFHFSYFRMFYKGYSEACVERYVRELFQAASCNNNDLSAESSLR